MSLHCFSNSSSMPCRRWRSPFPDAWRCCAVTEEEKDGVHRRSPQPKMEKLEPPRTPDFVDSASPFQLGVSWMPSNYPSYSSRISQHAKIAIVWGTTK
ncbi:hypothetical protein V8C26DRAFT_412563 [Trichoderma gracile]